MKVTTKLVIRGFMNTEAVQAPSMEGVWASKAIFDMNAVQAIDIGDDEQVTFDDVSGVCHVGRGPFIENEAQFFREVTSYEAWRVVEVITTRVPTEEEDNGA
jgi:hypothetical protein